MARRGRPIVSRWAVLALALAFALAPGRVTAEAPKRIVSLNLCTDQILVDLVPRERLAAVTKLAADPSVSAAPRRFDGVPSTYGSTEDVLAYKPDLIVAGAYTTPATVSLLQRLGWRVVVVPLPESLEGVRALITTLADAVEAPEAGVRLIADMDTRIARARVKAGADQRRPGAIVYQINDYVVGRGGLLDEALQIAGLTNAGAALKKTASGKTDLEAIVATPPDVIVLATRPNDYATVVGDNLRHPALTTLMQRVPTIVLPWPLWLCGTHHIADAIERLADVRAQLLAKRAPSQ